MRFGKPDANQSQIVADLRDVYGQKSVRILSMVGQDFPDICVGAGGLNFLFEIKTKKGKLSPGQVKFAAEWQGQTHKIETAQEAIAIITGCLTSK